MRSISLQTVDKVIFVQRKVLGNEEFPKWNPQTGFTSVEENSEFQGFLADGMSYSCFCLNKSKFLIST